MGHSSANCGEQSQPSARHAMPSARHVMPACKLETQSCCLQELQEQTTSTAGCGCRGWACILNVQGRTESQREIGSQVEGAALSSGGCQHDLD